MNTKHTPSPWRLSTINPHAVNANSKDLTIGIATTHGTDDANYSDFFPSTEEAKANARLIAAAPELLDALVELTKWANVAGCGREEGSVLDQNINAARAAIAKATNQ